ncbi:MAG TPA: metallophosphoesterase [Terriglobales bacterium]|nr:metallophosphoesterase [Terriglobales bacterium]
MRRFLALTVLLACELAHASGPQFFVNMSDPQMGMFAKNQDTLQEQANLSFVVASINRLKPAFVVVCGDLVNRTADTEQISQYKRIIGEIDPHIPVYNVAGNHDVGNQPTPETLAQYRKSFGRDYYTFDSGEVRGIVLDSNLIASPKNVSQESQQQEQWLVTELQRARREGVKHIFIFQHIPYFLERADEPDQYFNIPLTIRRHYLELFHQYGVDYVFAGHYHRNASGRDGNLDMITTGAVGLPMGGSQSGFRLVRIGPAVESNFYDLGAIPHAIDPAASLPPCVGCAR